MENDKPENVVDKDLIRKLYQQLAETPEYKTYIAEQSRDKKADKEILEFIFNTLMLPNNIFEEQIEEQFNNWDDDGEMMQQLINNLSSTLEEVSKSLEDVKKKVENMQNL